jgi:hypothetical protein
MPEPTKTTHFEIEANHPLKATPGYELTHYHGNPMRWPSIDRAMAAARGSMKTGWSVRIVEVSGAGRRVVFDSEKGNAINGN